MALDMILSFSGADFRAVRDDAMPEAPRVKQDASSSRCPKPACDAPGVWFAVPSILVSRICGKPVWIRF